MTNGGNVAPFRSLRPPGNGGDDGGYDNRLRTVELDVREIKTRMENVATQADVLKVRLWVVGGVIGGIVTASFLVLSFLRSFPF